MLRDYAYADYLGPDQQVREVALAAFAATPPSYQSARLAIALTGPESGTEHVLRTLRGLGAPTVVALGPAEASIWRFRGENELERTAVVPTTELANIIATNAADWSPVAAARSASIVTPGPQQLDLADLGLLPLIERQVNEKLDRLIREVIAGCSARAPSLATRRGFPQLVRILFWLLTAKVMFDRKATEYSSSAIGGTEALAMGRQHYDYDGACLPTSVTSRKTFREVTEWAWKKIRKGFFFQNLSIDNLAFVYENTLVSPQIRRRLGIHGTPRAIAELVVAHCPLEALPEGRDIILEPCCGFAPFLLASFRRLRQGKLATSDPPTRHAELVRRLRGIELDAFSIQVGKLCLTLADYPNGDGWQLRQDDVFAPGVLARELKGVGAILGNPPFEAFDAEDVQRYGAVRFEKPAELLRRILFHGQPEQLGLVVPRVVLDSPKSGYRALRKEITSRFRELDTIDLPDSVFEYSDAESVALVARGRQRGRHTRLRSALVPPADVRELLASRWQPTWAETRIDLEDEQDDAALRIEPLADLWRLLRSHPTLGDVSKVHQGIQFLRPLASARNELISTEQHEDSEPGVHRSNDLRPYAVVRRVFLSTHPDELRRAGKFPWREPKIIATATRRSRGWWPLVAAPDFEGLWCYQNLHGVWPQDSGAWGIELLTAVLNGPIANAHVACKENKRHIRSGTLASVPLPDPTHLDHERISDLVRKAAIEPTLRTLLTIDAEILRGYDLPPRLERQLLDRFEHQGRPGVPSFRSFYPTDFDSSLPLHRVLSDLGPARRADRLLTSVPKIEDPEATLMFDRLFAGYDH